jgi:hypothetical protein
MPEVNQTEKSFFVQIDLVYTPNTLDVCAAIPGYGKFEFDRVEGERDYQLMQFRLHQLVEVACALKFKMKFNDALLLSCVECIVATSPTLTGNDYYGLMVYEDQMLLYRLNGGEKISKPDQTNSVKICTASEF